MLNEKTDEELMVAYQLGEAEAFEILYARHSARVLGFLKKRIGNDALARDVFQATFLKLHRNRAKYDPIFPFVPWLFTVCRSELLDSFKIAHRKHEVFVEEMPEPNVTEEISGPEISLSALPTVQRKAIELRFQDNFSFEEIAMRLETSPLNARQLVSRGIRALRGIYGKK